MITAIMISNKTYNEISAVCQKLIKSSDSTQVVMGDAFGIEPEGTEAFDSVLLDHDQRGKVQVNATRSAVRPPFEWHYEITLRGEPFKHYLVQDKGVIVEAYAKNIIPVEQAGAEELFTVLNELIS